MLCDEDAMEIKIETTPASCSATGFMLLAQARSQLLAVAFFAIWPSKLEFPASC